MLASRHLAAVGVLGLIGPSLLVTAAHAEVRVLLCGEHAGLSATTQQAISDRLARTLADAHLGLATEAEYHSGLELAGVERAAAAADCATAARAVTLDGWFFVSTRCGDRSCEAVLAGELGARTLKFRESLSKPDLLGALTGALQRFLSGPREASPPAAAAPGPRPVPKAGEAAPPKKEKRQRRRRRRGGLGLIIGGWVTFGVSYFATVGSVSLACLNEDIYGRSWCRDNEEDLSLIPVVGGLLAATKTDEDSPYLPLGVLSMLVQTGGLTMAILGHTRRARPSYAERAAEWVPVVHATDNGGGLVWSGRW